MRPDFEEAFAIIVLGGDPPRGLAAAALTALWPRAGLTVAADSGAESLLEPGYLPGLLVGDADSIQPQLLRALQAAGVPFLRYPVEKDVTDGEAAYQAAFARGYRQLAVFGAGGGRWDHLLGNLLLPLAYRQQWDRLIFYSDESYAWYCFGDDEVRGAPGDTVSFVPSSDEVREIYLEGFYYPLHGVTTQRGSSLCLSNQLVEPVGRVRFARGGIMLAVHTPQRVENNDEC